MAIKIIVIIGFLIVLYCLASGVYYLVREEGVGSSKLAKALTWRIIVSICLFAFIMLAYFLGWIAPHPIAIVQ